jgi:PLP dependent protein
VHLLHSGDSDRLLAELDGEVAAAAKSPLAVLLEVNVSGEAAKHGFGADDFGRTEDELKRSADRLAALEHLDVRGLMCMAGLDDDPAAARRDFARLGELRDRLARAWSGRFTLAELSMGMSGDFEAAIAEGATIVRVGSALFEGCEEETPA